MDTETKEIVTPVMAKSVKIVDDLVGTEHPYDIREKLRVMWDSYATSDTETTSEQRADVYRSYKAMDTALEQMEDICL